MRPATLVMTAVFALATTLQVGAAAGTDELNMFSSPGPRQSAADFKPAPDRIKTNFGTLEFEGGAFPTDATTRRSTMNWTFSAPPRPIWTSSRPCRCTASSSRRSRDFGFKTPSDIGVMADFMHPSENYLTGNDITVYAFASIDLKVDGPTVVEIPPGMYGTANDANFKYLTDFGPTGPDKGKGGKLSVPAAGS